MADNATSSEQPTPAEHRKLRRLNRAAAREAARRMPPTLPAVGRAGEHGSPGPPGRGDRLPIRRWFRHLASRLALLGIALMLLMVVWPPFLIPVDGSVTSRFFLRTVPESPFFFDVERHRGIDIGAPVGTRVGAARSGRVISVRNDPAYGMVVDVRHALGMVTRYAHLSRVDVSEGRWLWRGRKVGEVGMSGRATGPHLHFEIRIGQRSVPPGFFLIFHQVRRSVVRGA